MKKKMKLQNRCYEFAGNKQMGVSLYIVHRSNLYFWTVLEKNFVCNPTAEQNALKWNNNGCKCVSINLYVTHNSWIVMASTMGQSLLRNMVDAQLPRSACSIQSAWPPEFKDHWRKLHGNNQKLMWINFLECLQLLSNTCFCMFLLFKFDSLLRCNLQIRNMQNWSNV